MSKQFLYGKACWCTCMMRSWGHMTGSSGYLESIDRKVYGAKSMYIHMKPIMATRNKW